ncbi:MULTISPECIES: tellurium resistance protein TerC [Actinomyces]|uniref:tellurium resistance protein TerC n=1 Tax=Actinomyces TaxID=1654 RepID=UPI001F32048C|nr:MULTISPECIES: tellurium resistance protein TerC [Actinomyces]
MDTPANPQSGLGRPAPAPASSRPGYGTRRGSGVPKEPGIVDPAWTRLAVAGLIPVLLAASAPMAVWARMVLVVVLILAMAQGWPALVRARHDSGSTSVIALTGVVGALAVAWRQDYGAAGVVMALSVLIAFVAQMLRKGDRRGLLESLSSTVSGALVAISGAAWCALEPGVADPAVIVPCSLALFIGALLTTLEARASVLETLTMTLPAVISGAVGGLLALIGFFGPAHTGLGEAAQSGAACLIVGFTAGVLMAAANRVLWTHQWVPGGRAAIASAIVPILAVGAPSYAIARLMGSFVAG